MKREEKHLTIFEKATEKEVNGKVVPDQLMSLVIEENGKSTLVLNQRPVLAGDALWMEDILGKLQKFVRNCLNEYQPKATNKNS